MLALCENTYRYGCASFIKWTRYILMEKELRQSSASKRLVIYHIFYICGDAYTYIHSNDNNIFLTASLDSYDRS